MTMAVPTISLAERELLLAHILGVNRPWIITHPEPTITEDQRRLFQTLCWKRARGTPIAYLIGKKEFYGRAFTVGPGVLIPRPETEHLVEAVLSWSSTTGRAVIVDVGTGSGCIAVTIALECPSVSVMATDMSQRALRYARMNIDRYNVGDRISLLHGDLLQPILDRGIIPDLIVANLPYLTPKEIKAVPSEPRTALIGGQDGLEVFQRFFAQLSESPKTPTVILEVDPRRAHAVRRIATMSHPTWRAKIARDLAGFERVLVFTPAVADG